MQRNLTKGPITVNLLFFALPLMFGNLLQQLYNVADTWVVGRYLGADALAAVGSSYTLMTFLTSILLGLCMGSGAAISMLYGSGEKKKMRQSIFMAFCLIGAIALVINILVYLGMDGILWILRVPASIKGLMKDYLWVIFLGILATFLYNYFANLLRAIGNFDGTIIISGSFLCTKYHLRPFVCIEIPLGSWRSRRSHGIFTVCIRNWNLYLCICESKRHQDCKTRHEVEEREPFLDPKSVSNDKPAAIHHELWNFNGTRISKQLRNRHHGCICSSCEDRFLRIYASTGLWKCIFLLMWHKIMGANEK